ncbi:MAG: putative transporter substrate binding protein [Paenibacillaceae bacterium]|jgi:ribose transport system substrate-binding protein|nr:putative transporter substrate binding protein [Paenibacillaceae bacterium]
MIRWKKWKFLAAVGLLLLLSVACSLPGTRFKGTPEESRKLQITLVLGMRHGDYWKTVYTGAEAAAREYGVNLSFLAPDDEEDVEVQARLVRQALADGADALVLAPNDDTVLADAVKAARAAVPVITIDSGVDLVEVDSHIGTDNYQAGIQAAEEMIRLLEGKPARIGLMGFIQGTPKADLREQGIVETLKRHPEIQLAGKAYCYSEPGLAEELTVSMLNNLGPLDGMIALNSTASVGVAQVLEQEGMGKQVKLVAFDNTMQELELLQAGIIHAAVVQNPFGMGYLGVSHAVRAVNGGKIPANVDTGSRVVRSKDMFSPGNQKMLFPLLK